MGEQLGLALVRYRWWLGWTVVAWVRELERWPNGILVVGEHGRRWVPFENVLDATWLHAEVPK